MKAAVTEIDSPNLVLDTEIGLVYSKSRGGNEIDIRLSDEVDRPGEYLKIVQFISEMTQNDFVKLHLANYGGVVDGCIYLINAIRNSPATVQVVVHAPCYSCGSLLALSGDYLHMHEFTTLMFHNFSTHVSGKAGEVEHDLKYSKKTIHSLFKNICTPFLTNDEYDQIINDKDVTVSWNDRSLKRRLRRHFPNVRAS